MSAYASLSGSFLPPFFSFVASSSSLSTEEGGSEHITKDSTVVSNDAGEASSKHKLATLASFSGRSSSEPNISAFRALALSSPSSSSLQDIRAQDDGGQQASASKPSAQSDIDVSIRSARVDPVQLIKSLTSKGSSIARMTANYVAASVPGGGASQSAKTETADNNDGGDSLPQSPSFCMTEHTDCSEDSGDDLSFYDYDDDFSSSNCNDDDEDYYMQHKSLDEKSSERDDPAAIQFELAISFQGRKYTATRAFSTFVKLRNDLLRESGDTCVGISVGGNRRSRHYLHRTKSNSDERGAASKCDGDSTSISVPELPTVTPENAECNSYAWTGVARSGFALLQATAKLYCPEMEKWLQHVVNKFPYSPSLGRFLWEPLGGSSHNIVEEDGEGEEDDGKSNSTGENASDLGSKPPLPSKTRTGNNSRKTSRFTSKNSCGSLNSIVEEEVHDECDDAEDW